MSAVYSHDGLNIVSASLDNSVRIWDVTTGLMLAKWRVGGAVLFACLSPDSKTVACAVYKENPDGRSLGSSILLLAYERPSSRALTLT